MSDNRFLMARYQEKAGISSIRVEPAELFSPSFFAYMNREGKQQ